MNTKVVTVTEVVRNFSDYIGRVAYRRESFILRKGNKPMAELRPLPSGCRLGDLPELLRAVPRLSDGDAAAFARDLDAARSSLPDAGGSDPWAS